MRLIIMLFLLWLFSSIGLGKAVLENQVNLAGAFCGVISGILAGIIGLIRSKRLASKGIFIDKMTKKELVYLFLVILPLFILLGTMFVFLRKKYFPNLDLTSAINSALLLFCFTLFFVGVLGICFLERRYGKKFYIGKRD